MHHAPRSKRSRKADLATLARLSLQGLAADVRANGTTEILSVFTREEAMRRLNLPYLGKVNGHRRYGPKASRYMDSLLKELPDKLGTLIVVKS